ncbi:MAG: 16S rRNA (adenine(1518)-N(6)/adenine(1519)-N(6))-dimethyltransferase RsmA [Syntrophaceae bacterium]
MKAKRSLGQNFLKSPAIAERMALYARIAEGDIVLEIGPGRGRLTRVLLDQGAQVVAVEKDDHLYALLGETFKDRQNLQLIHEDILECDLSRLIPEGTKLVANLPYNIATQLIMRLVEHARHLSSIVVMLQKEVAQRICACVGDKTYSGLSVIVSAGFDAEPGFMVGPENFIPRPKVDSQVVKLVPKAAPISAGNFDAFRKVVFCAFSQRRKVLRNTLMGLPRMDQDVLGTIAERADISLRCRPQEISMEKFLLLSLAYTQYIDDRPPEKRPS